MKIINTNIIYIAYHIIRSGLSLTNLWDVTVIACTAPKHLLVSEAPAGNLRVESPSLDVHDPL